MIDHILVKDFNSNSKSGIFLELTSCLVKESAFNNFKDEKVRTRVIYDKSKEEFNNLLASENCSDFLNENRPEKIFALFF